ncbi:MAG TPA: ABC transporter permease [Vicinamibacterales bacterium]|nr:ABC transporter permease [Vicinamibacterales bacterium]
MTLWLDALRSDVACALRGLRRSPAVTTTVVIVLGAAIGLNATLFTVIAGVAWRPWGGVTDPGAVIRIYAKDPSGQPNGLSLTDARALAGRATTLLSVGAMRGDSVDIKGIGAARALLITGNLMDLLGLAPTLGRRIVSDDDRPGSPAPVAMLAHTTWVQRFGGDPRIVGSQLWLDDVPFTVIGIAPANFEAAEPAYDIDVFLPAGAFALIKPGADALRLLSDPRACCADVVARLRPGVTRAQAAAELSVMSREWTAMSGLPARGAFVSDTALLSQPGRSNSPQALLTATMLAGGLVLVWLIACANVGNLLLSRTMGRMHEIGTRAALGASRVRLLRLLLTEGAVLGILASSAGIAVAAELPRVLFALVADASTRVQFPFPVAPDVWVLGYVIVLGLLSALVFSLAPAMLATSVASRNAMGRGVEARVHRLRLRSLLLGVQVAVSVTLLLSAGLLVRGAQLGAASFNPGFRVAGIVAVNFLLPERTYDRARATTFFAGLDRGVRSQPDTEFAFASRDPFSLYREGTFVRLPGDANDRLREVLYTDVSPNYLGLLEIPLRAGRTFSERDTGQPAVIVNEAMAQALWPGRDPVGQSFVMRRRGPAGEMVAQEVIGIARNVSVSATALARPMFYRAVAPGTEVLDFIGQDPRASQAPTLLVKGRTASAAGIRALTARIDSRVAVTLTPLADQLNNARASMKWGPIVAAVLGAFALLLATVGMFGVFSYAVQQRTREIGVRMALGAPTAAVVRLVIAGHSRAVLAGVGAGLVGALAASIGLRARLFGLSPLDPLSYATVALLLAACGIAATYVPVRRAARISPVVALRTD